MAAARSWIGTPYVHQQSTIGVGCDCLGLIRGVWRSLYGDEPEEMPPYTRVWAKESKREVLYEAASRHMVEVDAMPYRRGNAALLDGDLFLLRMEDGQPASHCVITVAPNQMIHAYETRHAVGQNSFPRAWRRRIMFVFQFPDLMA